MDDLDLFLDHWIISRQDGSHILNGQFEDFAKELRDFIKFKDLYFVDLQGSSNGNRDADTY